MPTPARTATPAPARTARTVRTVAALLVVPAALTAALSGCSTADPHGPAPATTTASSPAALRTAPAAHATTAAAPAVATTRTGVLTTPSRSVPRLGAPDDNPSVRGLGEVRPRAIDFGGADPGFVVEDITWKSWGGRRAVGHGTAVVAGDQEPGTVRPSRVTVVAFDRGTCAGNAAYRQVEWYDPAKGGAFDRDAGLDTCLGPTAPLPHVDEPWAAGLDFGFLKGARIDRHGRLVVTFDRAQWLTGKAYDAYVAKHGVPENDYVILNESARLRTFVVTPSATLYGNQTLGRGEPTDDRIVSPERIVREVRRHGGDFGVPVWLQHTGGRDGRVVYLAEQYLP